MHSDISKLIALLVPFSQSQQLELQDLATTEAQKHCHFYTENYQPEFSVVYDELPRVCYCIGKVNYRCQNNFCHDKVTGQTYLSGTTWASKGPKKFPRTCECIPASSSSRASIKCKSPPVCRSRNFQLPEK